MVALALKKCETDCKALPVRVSSLAHPGHPSMPPSATLLLLGQRFEAHDLQLHCTATRRRGLLLALFNAGPPGGSVATGAATTEHHYGNSNIGGRMVFCPPT